MECDWNKNELEIAVYVCVILRCIMYTCRIKCTFNCGALKLMFHRGGRVYRSL